MDGTQDDLLQVSRLEVGGRTDLLEAVSDDTEALDILLHFVGDHLLGPRALKVLLPCHERRGGSTQLMRCLTSQSLPDAVLV